MIAVKSYDIQKKAEVEQKKKRDADDKSTKGREKKRFSIGIELFEEFQPLMEAMDNAENGEQPDDSGNAKLTESDISGEDCYPQGEKSQAVEQIEDKIPGHRITRVTFASRKKSGTGKSCNLKQRLLLLFSGERLQSCCSSMNITNKTDFKPIKQISSGKK